ncbi:MAG: PepSY-like domain-containing protein [Bacteroides sp.]|nr:PepSY-like domain-containing protein [Bacteroides sp.]
MMRTRAYYIFILAWMLATIASAVSPAAFSAALKKMYPQAREVAWNQQGNYYVATFTLNGFEKKVWMNANAQWVITNTDLQTADQLTPSVYNDFTLSQYSTWTVNDVNLMAFPKRAPLYIITVNQDNSVSTYQLFYALDGRLLQTRNVSYISPALSPEVFDFQ